MAMRKYKWECANGKVVDVICKTHYLINDSLIVGTSEWQRKKRRRRDKRDLLIPPVCRLAEFFYVYSMNIRIAH